VAGGEVAFRAPRGRLLWGSPPGQERPGEADAGLKLERLPEAKELAGRECDLRPAGGAKSRALPR
jgi:hypothetical protein